MVGVKLLDKCTIKIALKPDGTAIVEVEGDENGFYLAGAFSAGVELEVKPYDLSTMGNETNTLPLDELPSN